MATRRRAKSLPVAPSEENKVLRGTEGMIAAEWPRHRRSLSVGHRITKNTLWQSMSSCYLVTYQPHPQHLVLSRTADGGTYVALRIVFREWPCMDWQHHATIAYSFPFETDELYRFKLGTWALLGALSRATVVFALRARTGSFAVVQSEGRGTRAPSSNPRLVPVDMAVNSFPARVEAVGTAHHLLGALLTPACPRSPFIAHDISAVPLRKTASVRAVGAAQHREDQCPNLSVFAVNSDSE